MSEAWRDNLVTDQESIARIVRECKRIAVLGMKTEAQRDQPAFYVPEYMARAGYDIVPVPAKPASTRSDSPRGVTISVDCPPSTSIT